MGEQTNYCPTIVVTKKYGKTLDTAKYFETYVQALAYIEKTLVNHPSYKFHIQVVSEMPKFLRSYTFTSDSFTLIEA